MSSQLFYFDTLSITAILKKFPPQLIVKQLAAVTVNLTVLTIHLTIVFALRPACHCIPSLYRLLRSPQHSAGNLTRHKSAALPPPLPSGGVEIPEEINASPKTDKRSSREQTGQAEEDEEAEETHKYA